MSTTIKYWDPSKPVPTKWEKYIRHTSAQYFSRSVCPSGRAASIWRRTRTGSTSTAREWYLYLIENIFDYGLWLITHFIIDKTRSLLYLWQFQVNLVRSLKRIKFLSGKTESTMSFFWAIFAKKFTLFKFLIVLTILHVDWQPHFSDFSAANASFSSLNFFSEAFPASAIIMLNCLSLNLLKFFYLCLLLSVFDGDSVCCLTIDFTP